jgi:hypothetical protein
MGKDKKFRKNGGFYVHCPKCSHLIKMFVKMCIDMETNAYGDCFGHYLAKGKCVCGFNITMKSFCYNFRIENLKKKALKELIRSVISYINFKKNRSLSICCK